MTITTFVELITAVTLIIGLIFAIIQLRQYRASRERESALELLRSFETPEFAASLRAILNLPSDLSTSEIEEQLGDKMDLVQSLMNTWESLGILVFRREVSLDLVGDFFSGPITISWGKLQRYVIEERERQKRETLGEWFQWLAERTKDLESVNPPVPAHIAHRDWHQGRQK